MPDPSKGQAAAEEDSFAALLARCEDLERRNRSLEEALERMHTGAAPPVGSEERYRAILDSEPACVKLVAEDGTLMTMNPAGLAMVGARSEAEVIGCSVYDLVAPEDRAAFETMHRRVFAGESTRLEFGIVGLQGQARQMETFAAPLHDDDGRIVAQLAVTHDITERKREQAELQAYRERLEALVARRTRALEASRAEARRNERLASLGTLAAGLAHELNNPLGTILLGSQMATLVDDPEERTRALQGIRRDVERCHQIVKNMLRFAHDDTAEKFPLSLNQVIREAGVDTREILEKRDLTLETSLAVDLPLLRGNAVELGQVLINLIQNAAQASDASGRIVIRTQRVEAEVICEVEDFGCGMPEHVLERARDPFFTTRLADGGTGLGLSVSHGIVTDHDGRLEIESAPGRGTLVKLALPVVEATLETAVGTP